MNSASRPVGDISRTCYHASHTSLANSHKQVPAENNCTHLCVVWVRLVRDYSIRGALSLNLVLIWPMRLLCPLCSIPITHYPVEHFHSAYLPAPAPLTFLFLLQKLYVHVHFHFDMIYLEYPGSEIIMFQLNVCLSSRTCGEHVLNFLGSTLCNPFTQLRICTA